MSNESEDSILNAAVDAAQSAAKSLLADFRRARSGSGSQLKTWLKAPGALVTEADIAADKAIASSLAGSNIDAALISEESSSGDASSDQVWLIDPLCGTVPFRAGMSHWGVNIALRRRDQIVAGVITLPLSGDILAAAQNTGVKLNDEPLEGIDPGLPLHEATVGLEIDGGDWARVLGLTDEAAPPLRWPGSVSHTNTFASAAYPLFLVATGAMSGVVFYRIDSVHLAAGALIAQEAGAIVSDERGNPLDWTSDQAYEVAVIAWPSVHADLIAAM